MGPAQHCFSVIEFEMTFWWLYSVVRSKKQFQLHSMDLEILFAVITIFSTAWKQERCWTNITEVWTEFNYTNSVYWQKLS